MYLKDVVSREKEQCLETLLEQGLPEAKLTFQGYNIALQKENNDPVKNMSLKMLLKIDDHSYTVAMAFMEFHWWLQKTYHEFKTKDIVF